MPTVQVPSVEISVPSPPPPAGQGREARRFLRRASVFVGIGVLLYAGLYVGSELLIHRYALRNRFYMVQTAPLMEYDYVILGASHAAVFDYRDMNAQLERLTGARILNLATVGGGVTINRLLLDYFHTRRTTSAVVYVLDSFAFYAREWNEDRLRDTQLFVRAPWDPALVRLLLREPAARSAALDYALGFSKINNPDRFEPDRLPAEGSSFDRAYRPIAQIDRQRIDFLYPAETTGTSLAAGPYIDHFEDLIRDVQAHGARFIVVRPPIPERFRAMIPNEDEFGAALAPVLERNGVELYDFSRMGNEPEYFYDTDHLNEAGMLNFFENYLAPVLPPRETTTDYREDREEAAQ